MRKFYLLVLFTVLFAILVGCGKNEALVNGKESKGTTEKKTVTLKIGASSTPHAEILEFIKPKLEKEGVKLDIKIINDGILTNEQTANGELDANYFQHTPFLKQTNKDSSLNLVKVVGVHIEPFGVYSKKIKSIDELPKGAKIAIPKDPVNFSRALQLFAANGLIELNESSNTNKNYTVQDIKKNEKKLQFIPVDGPLLVRALDDVEAAAINTNNYALEAGLKPKKDALIIEGDKSPYVYILVARPDNKDSDAIQKLTKALTSPEVKKFIEDKYDGAVVPAF
ncbi:MetQ/NlpA family ABC transporter substrate-binding protein [Bacillus smithii]|uniref:MetQ/NlpA family ABC transporter substrate-binding protein n=1 Tax=Bacillus smithii TaxID=1479 RepID=UPI002E22AC80|nr:MetQ/NlpA family ABC transporter substrate-binding protein [Bacillus smithii]MED4928999.1 MetQ/NlpA family ABC transporter substrate-binding protein [Bacillus smithii]